MAGRTVIPGLSRFEIVSSLSLHSTQNGHTWAGLKVLHPRKYTNSELPIGVLQYDTAAVVLGSWWAISTPSAAPVALDDGGSAESSVTTPSATRLLPPCTSLYEALLV